MPFSQFKIENGEQDNHMNSHISTKKKIFVIIIVSLMVIILLGGVALKNNTGLLTKDIYQNMAYLKYKYLYRGEFADAVNTVNTNSVPVLLYHGITNVSGKYNITQRQFAEQMRVLKKAGYETINLSDFYSFMKGEKELPEKTFLLTFDDGRKDSYYGADPILKLFGYSAVMYIPTANSFNVNNIGNGYYLDLNQLKLMLKTGRWEIGSHAMQQTGDNVPVDKGNTRANFLSNKKWLIDENRLETDQEYEDRVNKELTQSKEEIQSILNVPVTSFAYPSSDYGQQSKNNFENAKKIILKYVISNYQMAFQQISSDDGRYTQNYRGDNMYYLHRLEPENDWDGEKLLSSLEPANSKSLPYASALGKMNNWKKIWGIISQTENTVILTTNNEKSGSGAFLDGTRYWENYNYQTTVNGDIVTSVTLYSRYQDEDNNLSCTFTNSYIKISEKIDGKNSILAEIDNENTMIFKDTVFGVSVNNDIVVCSLGEKELLGANHHKKIKNGGIGLSIWDPVFQERRVVFSDITAKEISKLTLPRNIKNNSKR